MTLTTSARARWLALAGFLFFVICGASPSHAQTAPGAIQFTNSIFYGDVNSGSLQITVSRVGGSSGAAAVTYSTYDETAVAGTDYSTTAGSLSWNDGDATPRTISVPILPGSAGGRMFALELLSASGATFGSTILANAYVTTAASTAPAPNAAGAVQFSAALYYATNAGALQVTVQRLGGSTGPAAVTYSTYDETAVAGTDYSATAGSLSWSDGDATPRTISVPILSTGTGGRAFALALLAGSGAQFGNPIVANVYIFAPNSVSQAPASVTGSAAQLLSYIDSLSGQTGQHILIGQHSNFWDTVPTDDLTGLFQQTGKNPAIVGLEFGLRGTPESIAGGPYSGVALANQYLSQGYIVMISELPGSPLNGTAMWGQALFPDIPMPASNFANITVPGTPEYGAFQTYLQQLAATLKQINGPVLFRPFAEQNGTWFWWGNQNPAQFIAMWQMEYQYLTSQGVTNLIWVYTTNAGMGNYAAYYPGAAYADIVAADSYGPNPGDAALWQALSTLGKPEIYAEAGAALVSETTQFPANTLDNSAMLATVERDFPQIVGMIVWCQSVALDNQLGAVAVMNDPQVITQSDLPRL